ncbi:MAG: insulinase family protein [Candidatus Dormibacteria bacterium]
MAIAENGIAVNTGYEVVRTEQIPAIKSTYHELVHPRTGARHVHIECDDENNLFSVIFKTLPEDSTGVAHILEHVVLCGSERYPLKDPFFKLSARSTTTFLNAMTSSDWTQYPFATRNPREFANILDVYLDATFFPRIEEDAFKQEGHRLEFEQGEDPTSGLRFKGVVFNEMKSDMASPGGVMSRAIGRILFPGTTYANSSGGFPPVIPQLTWEQLRAFHARHYHPGNARFFTYGNLPLGPILETIEERVLSRFERTADADFTIPDVARLGAPEHHVEPYALGPSDDPATNFETLVAWLTVPTTDVDAMLRGEVLGEVLLANPSSILRARLESSGLGKAMASGSGFNTSRRQATFAAGLKGVRTENTAAVEALVIETLAELARDGIPAQEIQSAVHQVELSSRERSNSGYPLALKTLFRVLPQYLYDGDPMVGLDVDRQLARLRSNTAESWKETLREWFVDNPHRATIVLSPDQQMVERMKTEELERLARLESDLISEQVDAIVLDARRLKERQEREDDESCLPSLKLEDIAIDPREAPHQELKQPGGVLEFYPQATAGFTYVDVRAAAGDMGLADASLLGLLAYAMPLLGAGGADHLAMSRRIAAVTGGITVSTSAPVGRELDDLGLFLTLSGKALTRNQEGLVGIVTDLVTSLDVDPDRLYQLVGQRAAQLEAGLSAAAPQYAYLRVAAQLRMSAARGEATSGLPFHRYIKKVAAAGRPAIDATVAEIARLRSSLFDVAGLRVVVAAEEQQGAALEKLTEGLLALRPGDHAGPPAPLGARGARKVAISAGVNVAANAMGFATVPYDHEDAPVFPVLAAYLQASHLHPEIREKGGAYGGVATANSRAGTLVLFSYRDPNIRRTFDVFGRSRETILARPMADGELGDAILKASKALDPLESPEMKARRTSLDLQSGYTTEAQRRFGERLLRVTAADVRRCADEYLDPAAAPIATIASPAAVEEASRDEFFEVVETL